MQQTYNIAIVGATGAIGRELIAILEEKEFPVAKLFLFCSNNSAGDTLDFNDKSIITQNISGLEALVNDEAIDIVFSCASSQVSEKYITPIIGKCELIIDKTDFFRFTAPLIVPEINGNLLDDKNIGLVSNPNCVAIPLSVCLSPIADKIQRAVISTYQSVSGIGSKALEELYAQIASVCQGHDVERSEFMTKQIAFNVIPQAGSIDIETGITTEEDKIMRETQRVLGVEFPISATCVRVPTLIGHAISVNLQLSEFVSIDEMIESLTKIDGVHVITGNADGLFPTPFECIGNDGIFVGRIRYDESVEYGLNMWICCDNLRKGAALNAVQIAQRFFEI